MLPARPGVTEATFNQIEKGMTGAEVNRSASGNMRPVVKSSLAINDAVKP
jgi:hypothetical protein